MFKDDCLDRPQSGDGTANQVDFTVCKQGRVLRCTCSAELNGLVHGIESPLILQLILHHSYCGTTGPPGQLDKLEAGLDLGVDAKAIFDAVKAVDVCDPAGSSRKAHLISLRDCNEVLARR